MATIKYQEDDQGDKKIIVKTDYETNQQKVSCGCCIVECDGCGTLLGALPATGTPPVKPTSLGWSASFSLVTGDPACGDSASLSGIIDQQSDGCYAGVGDVFRCYTQHDCEEWNGCYSGYGSSVWAQILIGKYKVEVVDDTSSPCGPFSVNTLVPDTSPEAECAYWLIMGGGEGFGAQGWFVSSPNLYPIPPEQIIGSHQISCTVYAGTIGYEFNEETQESTNICESQTSITRSATITIS
jgi:hypothetical protein